MPSFPQLITNAGDSCSEIYEYNRVESAVSLSDLNSKVASLSNKADK